MIAQLAHITDGWALIVDCAVWALAGTTTGYLTHRLAPRRLDHDTWLTRPRRCERPRFYEKTLRIKRWKDRVPEAGALFRGGFSKRHIRLGSPAYFIRFVNETRRAEITHWLNFALWPIFFAWNPWWLAVVMAFYAAVANLPFIAIQRYNRLRLLRVVTRSQAAAARSG